MLIEFSTDIEKITAGIFNKKHPAAPPLCSLQEIKDERLGADFEAEWAAIAAQVATLPRDVQRKLAAIHMRELCEGLDPAYDDTPMFYYPRKGAKSLPSA